MRFLLPEKNSHLNFFLIPKKIINNNKKKKKQLKFNFFYF